MVKLIKRADGKEEYVTDAKCNKLMEKENITILERKTNL